MKVFGQRAGWAVSDVRRARWMLRRDVWAPLIRPMPRLVPGRIQSNEARDDDVLRRAVRGLYPQDVGEPSGLTGRVRWTDAAAECARGKDLRVRPVGPLGSLRDGQRSPTSIRPTESAPVPVGNWWVRDARGPCGTWPAAGRHEIAKSHVENGAVNVENASSTRPYTVNFGRIQRQGMFVRYATRNSNRGARTCRSRKSGSICDSRAILPWSERESCPPTGYVIVWRRHRPTFV